MKVNRLETHDRLEYFQKDQEKSVAEGAIDCMTKNPLSLALQEWSDYIYMFAHPRTADDGVNKVMYWQPRLIKPEAQTNSYLFRAKSKTDLLEICWLLPPEELADQYKKGNVTANSLVEWSYEMFRKHKKKLEEPDSEDLKDEQARYIYRKVVEQMRQDLRYKKIYGNIIKPEI
jgi:hypothetical protein